MRIRSARRLVSEHRKSMAVCTLGWKWPLCAIKRRSYTPKRDPSNGASIPPKNANDSWQTSADNCQIVGMERLVSPMSHLSLAVSRPLQMGLFALLVCPIGKHFLMRVAATCEVEKTFGIFLLVWGQILAWGFIFRLSSLHAPNVCSDLIFSFPNLPYSVHSHWRCL